MDHTYQALSVFDPDSEMLPEREVVNKLLVMALVALGAVSDLELINVDRKMITWKHKLIGDIYHNWLKQYYSAQYENVAKQLVERLQGQSIPNGITLFSFGCGEGTELEAFYRELWGCKVNPSFGIDINPKKF